MPPWLCNPHGSSTLWLFTDHCGPRNTIPIYTCIASYSDCCISVWYINSSTVRITSPSFGQVSTRQLAVSSLTKGLSSKLNSKVGSTSITLTLSWVWWGRCEKKLSPEGGRKGGWRKKVSAVRPPGTGLEPVTCRVLGEGPVLHARGAV